MRSSVARRGRFDPPNGLRARACSKMAARPARNSGSPFTTTPASSCLRTPTRFTTWSSVRSARVIRPVLGLPPDWYKLKPYRARAVTEPRAVLAEFGTIIPDDVEIRVSDSTAQVRFLVLPKRPAGTDGLSEEELAALVTRDAMIGVVPVEFHGDRRSSQ